MDYQRFAVELQERIRRRDERLAELAHELGNYIWPLSLARSECGKPIATSSPSEFDSLVRILDSALPHLERFAQNLQQLSGAKTDRRDLHRELANVAEVIDRAVEVVRPLADERSHALVVRNRPEAMDAEIDVSSIEQALVNLLNNAVKYTDPGGRIEVESDCDGDYIIIRIRDTGIGMDEQTVARAFELYAREETREPDNWPGNMGIGLAFVKRIVELHGGLVQAESGTDAKGSEFTVRLPSRRKNG